MPEAPPTDPAASAPTGSASPPEPSGSPPPAATAGSEGASQALVPGVPGSPELPQEGALAFFNPDAVPYALFLVIGTAVVVRIVQHVANRVAERVVARRLIIKQTVTLLGFTAYGMAGVLTVLALFDLSASAIFAVSGTLAVAGGFLLKDLAESTVAGVSILVSRPFQVGDRISFGGFYGEVKDIGLRSVRLVTLDDNLVTIPSSKFLADPVACANAGSLDCMVQIRFYVSPEADHARAKRIVTDAVRSSGYLYLGKPVGVTTSVKLVDQLGPLVELTASAYVYDARHEKRFASDVTERVLEAFRRSDLALPRSAAA